MMLQRNLDARRAETSPAYRERIQDAARHLDESGIPGRRKQTGDAAPDFALDATDGRPVVLSDLLRAGPVVVSFFRGEWCPFCRAEIDALVAAQPAMARLGASLVLVSPEVPSGPLVSTVARLGDRAVLLRDRGLGVALLYGLVYRIPDALRMFYRDTDDELSSRLAAAAWMLTLPADFVIGSGGRIALSFADPDFTRRLDPESILESLRDAGRLPRAPAIRSH